jgi:hypothetical protein
MNQPHTSESFDPVAALLQKAGITAEMRSKYTNDDLPMLLLADAIGDGPTAAACYATLKDYSLAAGRDRERVRARPGRRTAPPGPPSMSSRKRPGSSTPRTCRATSRPEASA